MLQAADTLHAISLECPPRDIARPRHGRSLHRQPYLANQHTQAGLEL